LKQGGETMLGNIETMDKSTILSDGTFKELFSETNPILRTRCELALLERAQTLKASKEFDMLLKAYKASGRIQSKQVDKHGLSNSQTDIRAQFHRFRDGKSVGIYDTKIADYVISNHNIFIMGNIPYIYEGGVYIADDNEVKIKAIIKGLLYEDIITIDVINRVYRLILAEEGVQKKYEELNNYPKHWINFRNGMFDVINWKMEQHEPKYYSINQIPHELNLAAEPIGKNIDKLIKFAVPDEHDREMLYQYFGLCLTIDASVQKFMVFCGQAGTGKSILIRIIENIAGSRNISNISLNQLNERFFPSSLMGKILNSCADIPSRAMEAVDGIKKATGEDQLIYEKKGKDAYSFKSYAKLLFSANEIPINLEEKSEAIYRRMMILRIDNKPEKPDPQLWDKIKSEIDYVIYQSMNALKRLYENGGIQESDNSRLNVQELYETADNVLAFINNGLVKDTTKRTKQSELYSSYVKYCTETGRNPVSAFGFNKNLKNKGYHIIKSSGYPCYVGLSLPDTKFMQVPKDIDLPFE
jgi:P4 family phage/plasmid primase-like protien